MFTIHLILILAAVICFGLAAIGVNARVNLVGLGLFLSTLTQLLR